MQEELKPAACPFCAAALEPFGPDQHNHPRNDCWLSSVKIDRHELAAWNRRTPVSGEVAEGVALRLIQDETSQGIDHAKLDERAAFDKWAQKEYRNAESYTNSAYQYGLAAWQARGQQAGGADGPAEESPVKEKEK